MGVAQSSLLQRYDYDPATRVLMVTFVNGSTYRYDNVDPADYEHLSRMAGGGTAFWQAIRSKYQGIKIGAQK